MAFLEPARINRVDPPITGMNEFGAGRSTVVHDVAMGSSVTLRCPFSGIGDPSNVWTRYRVAGTGETNVTDLPGGDPDIDVR